MTRARRRPHRVPSRAELIARLPRGLRPKLDRDQLRELGLVHVLNLDQIAAGQADEALLWQFVGGILTWSRVADLLEAGQAEMREQIALASALVERYERTGRVIFTGPEYQLAKAGVGHMDDLAGIVDRPTAEMAADWSEAVIADMAAQVMKRAA